MSGVTQVEGKGHEGNKGVVTAYICWKKHGPYLSWGINNKNRLNARTIVWGTTQDNLCACPLHPKRKRRPSKLLLKIVLRNTTSGKNMSKRRKYYTIPARSKAACKPWVQYATDVENLLFLARPEFVWKTACVPHYFQCKEVTFLSFLKAQSQVLHYQPLPYVAYSCTTFTI